MFTRASGWPAKSLLAGTSVQVPFRALWSRANAENAKRRVVKTAPVILIVEYIRIISFQGLLEHARYRSGENGDRGRRVHAAGEHHGPAGAVTFNFWGAAERSTDRKSTRLNSSHLGISYAVFCLKKKKTSI